MTRTMFPFIVIMEDTEKCTRKEWLMERKKAVCSSDYPAIVGLSTFKTPLDLYLDKISMEVEEFLTAEQKYRFAIGHAMEPVIREAVALQIGAKPIHDKRMVESDLYPYMRSDIDGLLEMKEDRIIQGVQFHKGDVLLFEGKTTNTILFAEYRYAPPPMYEAQVKHAMIVRGLRHCIIGISNGGNNLSKDLVYHLVTLTAEDERLIPLICQEFWEKNVMKRIPPDHTLGPYATAFKKALMAYYAPMKVKDPPTMKLPAALIPAADQALRSRMKIAQLNKECREEEERRDQVEGPLVAMLGNEYQRAVIDSPHRTITVGYTITERTTCSAENLKRLEKDNPQLYAELVAEEYITSRVDRTFTVRQKIKSPRKLRRPSKGVVM